MLNFSLECGMKVEQMIRDLIKQVQDPNIRSRKDRGKHKAPAAEVQQNGPYLVSALVGEVQLRLLRAEVCPRPLGQHLQVNGFVRLHSHHQLVPLTAVGKYLARHVGELQTHLRLALVQGFATAEDERDPWQEAAHVDSRRLQYISWGTDGEMSENASPSHLSLRM